MATTLVDIDRHLLRRMTKVDSTLYQAACEIRHRHSLTPKQDSVLKQLKIFYTVYMSYHAHFLKCRTLRVCYRRYSHLILSHFMDLYNFLTHEEEESIYQNALDPSELHTFVHNPTGPEV
jgi:hypothetical protein